MKTINEMKLQIPGKSANEGFARAAVSAFAAQLDPTIDEIADIKTAVSEAVTNCIVHGYKDQIGQIYIHAKLYEDNVLTIKIRDKGCGIPNIKQAMEPLFTTCTTGERAGLGFAVMQSFMDKVRVTSKPERGTSVVLTKKLLSKGAKNA
ncbi:stage II sporulation protein AB (anti-sigma F factor) [Hydrogenoanaerobacterium saccharovorans]|uniref:Anti-sigma F factor n=1 Tax=Hydrogenoanaerobacterium saccharovorans TaxID=474960 RepID=A0A1H8D5V9_9FIRM|nr:anti-sigma F factor [Hydrogenoanaerobacterium saccharovorans]RPF43512.1 stage II sporulation protein AB (anti-sigma F factor) [Hydrogenoanaerobacterium saccharovorans]SEN02693.1 stage II sporulation protein AB (anti-sigma F factor) [Hydrogenoanaerobacterium saccharovorans]